jgi:hypothetical protein
MTHNQPHVGRWRGFCSGVRSRLPFRAARRRSEIAAELGQPPSCNGDHRSVDRQPPPRQPPSGRRCRQYRGLLFECRDLSMPFSADSEEAVELQAKPNGGCREGDAHDKPEEHEQKFVARGTRDHAVVPFCPAAQHCDSRPPAHCHGAGSKFGTPCSACPGANARQRRDRHVPAATVR